MRKIESGIDLVEINRFISLNPKIRERFIQRVFTNAEVDFSSSSFEHLAGKFAAKEAAAKALGCGIGEVHWQDLEILNESSGRPFLVLHNQAKLLAEMKGWSSWSVSISHTSTHATAIVTALADPKEV